VCSPGCVLADSPDGNYANDAAYWAQTVQPVDLRGWESCRLRYWLKGSVASGDALVASASGDGVTWSEVGRWSGSAPNGPTATYSLKGLDGQATVYLRFELRSDGSGTADGVSIDNVSIACEPVPGTYSSAEYAFARGTSFAAAYVSGAAALLRSACPTATAGQTRSALLDGVDALTSLAGKTVTGGRLNVQRSLGLLCATPTSPR
jgi:hypothetical protein